MKQEELSRRRFLNQASALGVVAVSGELLRAPKAGAADVRPSSQNGALPVEWRNKKDSMRYRRLGRTGLMVSEVVMGTVGQRKISLAREAIEKGLNYLDTAPRYGAGEHEVAIGEFLRESRLRDSVFLSTKCSSYLPQLDAFASDILGRLPSEKKARVRKKAVERMEELGVERPGYHYNYFEEHHLELPEGYLTSAVLSESGLNSGQMKALRETMDNELGQSLRSLRTDCIDVLHCPHGARAADELELPVVQEFFEAAKRAGKIRFSSVSIHSDVPQLLLKAKDLGFYDVAMVAYNIVNQSSMERALALAASEGMGLVAMKVARAINRDVEGNGIPDWRLNKLDSIIEGDMKPEVKSYLWALQNPSLSAVISAMDNSDMVKENLSIPFQNISLGRL